MTLSPTRGTFWVLAACIAIATAATAVVIVQAASLAGRLSPGLAPWVGWGLTALVAGAIAVAVASLLGSRPLAPPAASDSDAVDRYVRRLKSRLRANPACAGMPLATRDDVERALRALDATAEARVESFSRGVFMSTAVSQHGGLETLMTVGAQLRLVDEVACIYWGRVTLRERLLLWRYVWSTKAILTEVEGVGILEEARPVLGTVVGTALGAVPGLQVASHLFVDILLRGGGNALFSLRVGHVAMRWCGSLTAPDAVSVSADATRWAEPRLGPVMRAGAEALGDRVATEVKSLAGRGAGSVARVLGWGGPSDPTRDYRN